MGEIMAGRDPDIPPTTPAPVGELTVTEFLDRYYTNYVEAEGLKSAKTINGHLKALKTSLGELPVLALEKPGEIVRFKATYRQGHEVATVNRALGALRAAINWGRFRDPLLGHSDIKTTQRYLNITDEELRKALTGVWERRRQLKAVGQ